ncbi:MAG TPA: substrate-binding domain-containing protein [Solirubrobacteraceae bacterium]
MAHHPTKEYGMRITLSMSALKLCTAVLIGACVGVALLLSAAMGAGTAVAAEQCSGENIHGEGSSLQKVAQQLWDHENAPAGKGFILSAAISGCNGTQGSGASPTVTYNPSGSAAGLEGWGVNGSGKSPKEKVDQFIGTDDAPNAKQLHEIDLAALAASGQALVIPVAQAAIAVLVHYPSTCDLKENHISNSDLQKVWADEFTLWSQIAGSLGSNCNILITRVVRKDGSGTTYQFKHYLYEKNMAILPASGGRTWKDLQPETEPNREWPNEAADWKRSANNGGGGEVEEVEKTSGSIGYANLGDARKGFAGGVRWLAVENESTANTFVYPGTTSGEPSETAGNANCKETKYPNQPAGIGPDDDWSEVYGGHPKGNANYPICTLTWDVGLAMYESADLNEALGQTAHDYLNYVVEPKGGQKDLKTHDYGEVEEAVGTYAREEAALVNLGPLVILSENFNFGTLTLTESITKLINVTALTKVTFDTPTVTAIAGGTFTPTNLCTALLNVGESCLVHVTFKPTAMGASSATLKVPALLDGLAGTGLPALGTLKGSS